jgi:non-homologous end joining protein Ku
MMLIFSGAGFGAAWLAARAGIPEMRLPEEMLRIAQHLVETRKGEFDRAYLEDRYRKVMLAKLKEKHAARPAQRRLPRESVGSEGMTPSLRLCDFGP